MSLAIRSIAAAVAAAGLAPGPDPVDLVHRMPEGRTLEVTIRQDQESSITSQVYFPFENGELLRDEAHEFDVDDARSFHIEVVLRDVYGEVEGDRLQTLERTFESVDASEEWTYVLDGRTNEGDMELTTPLLGRTVAFAWDEDAEVHVARFSEDDDEDSGFDDVLLEDARIDGFGDWYLPPEDEAEVEVGDSWDAGVDAWHRTLDIGGDFWIGPEREEPPGDDEVEGRRSTRGQLRSGGEGEVICTYRGVEVVDDVEVAVVEIAFEVEVSAESEATWIPDEEEDEVVTKTELTIVVEGTGRLLWNAEESLPHALALEYDWTANETMVSCPADDDSEGDAWETLTEQQGTLEYLFRAVD